MFQIAVGSKNPAKIRAVAMAFDQMGIAAQMDGVNAPSGVSDQPFSNEVTMQGAVNRAKRALLDGEFDYGVGLEGGVEETAYGLMLCNWAAIAGKDGAVSVGAGVQILLPTEVAEEIRRGRELGEVIDEWAGGHDISKGEGTIGILTQGHISRSQMFRDAVICAFAPRMRPAKTE
ncbi:inosine/xanthosine triphosphatase [Alicyclobacillus fastidiosus]|uniref:Probable inosine/xanthosine triphosphatase n=1 Tax=Alicyclobacillus fastidiosus TaxID=392011 RepID=A0ABY6ZAC4_9BACL|nr:inosine/xanthosine triphosphatase [Alicyclobacillus fastidiosus]WAH39703.1 inosine/xanthosine triphosphatase [Alicyclobacillus fastidiosus]GMA60920.1 NTPase [Alicyclobacillus fastidiosus]